MARFPVRLARFGAISMALGVAFTTCRATGELPPLPTTKLEASELVQTLSHGKRVDLAESLRDGRWTIIAFEAEWCGACQALEPSLMSLIREKQTVALRQIDIVSWTSPVALQHGISTLPQLRLYDGTRLVSADRHEVMAILRQ